MLISHRGNNNHDYKENTQSAIAAVLKEDYIDGVEFDIRLTKDNKIVLCHNFIHNGKIIKYTNAKELSLDLLTIVLKNINTRKIILIEIKDNNKKIVDILYKIIKRYNNINFYFQSFYKEVLTYLKSKNSKLKVGIVTFNSNVNIKGLDFISIYFKNYKNNRLMTFLWTINNLKEIKKHQQLYIITDVAYKINTQKTVTD